MKKKHMYLILALIPLVYLIFFVFKYKIDAPSADDWDSFLPFVKKCYQGTLSLHDLWKGDGYGQRSFFSNIILLILVRLSGWNYSYALTAIILIAIGTFIVISYQIKMTAKAINNQGINWIIPIVSLIIFSLNQYGNWGCELGLGYILSMFAAVSGIILLANPVFKWSYFRSAVLLGIVATTTSSAAVSYWFSALFILFFVSPDNIRIRKLSIFFWLVIAFITIYLYIYKIYWYRPTHIYPFFSDFFEQPVKYIKLVMKYLGAPVMPYYGQKRGALVLVGLLGLIISCYACWSAIRFRCIKFKILIPYISLSLYSIGCAMLTMYARVGKINVIANSRYMTNASLFWISIVVFLYLLISANNKFKKHLSFVLILFVALMVCGSVYGTLRYKQRYHQMLPAQNALLLLKNGTLKDVNLLRPLKRKDPEMVMEGAVFLKEYRLNIFRDTYQPKQNNESN